MRTEEHMVTLKNCRVVNLFKSKEELERKQSVQAGIANIICRTESNQNIRYTRVK